LGESRRKPEKPDEDPNSIDPNEERPFNDDSPGWKRQLVERRLTPLTITTPLWISSIIHGNLLGK